MAVDPIAQTLCPVPLALVAIRADSIEIRVRFFDASTGRPIVLDGFDGSAVIYDSPNATVPLHTLTVVVDQSGAGQPTTGVVTITVAGSATQLWIERGYWALVLDSGAVRKTVIAGPWELRGPSLGGPAYVCGLCPVPGVAPIGAACMVVKAGYHQVVLPYPAGDCGC